jgi:alpha-mannosidase
VSLLNDCKYGHDIKGNTLRLTLLKSAVRPDAAADKGRHLFTYSLLPHAGDWRTGETVREAHQLNNPLFGALVGPQDGPLPPHHSFVSVDADHVMVETVKRVEDCAARENCTGDGWIVRVYDWQQRRSEGVRLRFGRPVQHAVGCNLVETAEHAVKYEGHCVVFDLRPFEIKTFKVWLETDVHPRNLP